MSEKSSESVLKVDDKTEKSAAGSHDNETSVGPSNDDGSPRIFKLSVDCLEEMFVWSPLMELLNLRLTCKKIKTIVDYHIRTYYPASEITLGTVNIDSNNIARFAHLEPFLMKLIKEVNINFVEIIPEQIEGIKEILAQAERIKVTEWYWNYWEDDREFYDYFLKYCVNLKHLSIFKLRRSPIVGVGNQWMFRNYPSLEYFQLDDTDFFELGELTEITELGQFFELNPSIQMFSTTFRLLRLNGHRLRDANIKLKQLIIAGDCSAENGMSEICNLLKDLHRQGFYQRIHVYVSHAYSEGDLNEITSLPGLKKLHLRQLSVVLPPLPNLKELNIRLGTDSVDLEAVAQNLKNVERIYFEKASFDHVLPFIRHSPKLKHVKILFLRKGPHYYEETIDLSVMNMERQGLEGAAKVTIYVDEAVYLTTKWETTRDSIGLVELDRGEAYKWSNYL